MTREQILRAAENARRAVDDRAEERMRECNAAYFHTQDAAAAAMEGKDDEVTP